MGHGVTLPGNPLVHCTEEGVGTRGSTPDTPVLYRSIACPCDPCGPAHRANPEQTPAMQADSRKMQIGLHERLVKAGYDTVKTKMAIFDMRISGCTVRLTSSSLSLVRPGGLVAVVPAPRKVHCSGSDQRPVTRLWNVPEIQWLNSCLTSVCYFILLLVEQSPECAEPGENGIAAGCPGGGTLGRSPLATAAMNASLAGRHHLGADLRSPDAILRTGSPEPESTTHCSETDTRDIHPEQISSQSKP